jgi:hypothetical protein
VTHCETEEAHDAPRNSDLQILYLPESCAYLITIFIQFRYRLRITLRLEVLCHFLLHCEQLLEGVPQSFASISLGDVSLEINQFVLNSESPFLEIVQDSVNDVPGRGV